MKALSNNYGLTQLLTTSATRSLMRRKQFGMFSLSKHNIRNTLAKRVRTQTRQHRSVHFTLITGRRHNHTTHLTICNGTRLLTVTTIYHQAVSGMSQRRRRTILVFTNLTHPRTGTLFVRPRCDLNIITHGIRHRLVGSRLILNEHVS